MPISDPQEIDASEYDLAFVDFDGTLLDTKPIWWSMHIQACASLGADKAAEELPLDIYLEKFDGTRMRDVAAYLIKHYDIDCDPIHFIEKRNAHWFDYLFHDRNDLLGTFMKEHVNQGLVKTLQDLRDAGCAIYLVSRNYGMIIIPTITHLGLGDLFDGYVTNCTPKEFRVSSDKNEDKEDTFNRLMEDHGANADRCIVFEDSSKNIESAIALGMHACKVSFDSSPTRS